MANEETTQDTSNGAVDWESRYKGQLREYNSLRTKYENSEQALEAQRTLNSELQQRISALSQDNKSIVKDYEEKLTEANANLSSYQSKLAAAESLVEEVKKEATKNSKLLSLQQLLSDPELASVKALVDKKIVTGLEDLEGDALQARILEIKENLQSVIPATAPKAQEPASPQKNLAGSTPPVPFNGSNKDFNKMTTEELRDWLMSPGSSNPADFEAVNNIYIGRMK